MEKEDPSNGVWRWINGHPVFIKNKKHDLKQALEEKYGAKHMKISGVDTEDVTKEYLSNSSPGEGRFIRQSGSQMFKFKKRKRDEISTETEHAFWLINTFGGDVMLLRENKSKKDIYVYPPGAKTPDLMWRFNGKNAYWDIKEPTKPNSGEDIFRHGMKQITVPYGQAGGHPGGLIIDLQKVNGEKSIEGTAKMVANQFRQSNLESLDVIIKKSDSEFKVLRFRK